MALTTAITNTIKRNRFSQLEVCVLTFAFLIVTGVIYNATAFTYNFLFDNLLLACLLAPTGPVAVGLLWYGLWKFAGFIMSKAAAS
ncbi:MAG: hypothetical protein JWN38_910 [Candidatus Saccharibacteria bacterium]|nr:hypothetical protein [Candidatus Saccharibacteria bacterium]